MLGIYWALHLWIYGFHQTWEKISHCLQIFFLCLPLTDSFRDSNCTYIRLLELLPEVTDSLLIFPIIRPPSHPCFILHIFYSYRIMFINLCVYVCVRGGAMSNLLLIPSNILFISEIYRFLSLKFWFWSSLCLPCFSLKFLTHPSLLILTSVSVLSYFKLIIFSPHFKLYFQESL